MLWSRVDNVSHSSSSSWPHVANRGTSGFYLVTRGAEPLRSRLAAHSLHAKGGTNTGPAKAAYDARWARLVDPDGSLSPGERERRAEHAKKAHYTAMALKSAKARRRRAA